MKKNLPALLLILTAYYSCESPHPHILRADTTTRHAGDTIQQGPTHIAPQAHDTTGAYEYLSQKSKEEKEGLQSDAALTLSPKKLVERAIWWENFIRRHPSFVDLQPARDQYSYYLQILLTGTDNTPSSSDGKIAGYFQYAPPHP